MRFITGVFKFWVSALISVVIATGRGLVCSPVFLSLVCKQCEPCSDKMGTVISFLWRFITQTSDWYVRNQILKKYLEPLRTVPTWNTSVLGEGPSE